MLLCEVEPTFKFSCGFYSPSRYFSPQLWLALLTHVYTSQTVLIKKPAGSVVRVHALGQAPIGNLPSRVQAGTTFLVLFQRLLGTGSLGTVRHWEDLTKCLQRFLPLQMFSKMEGWKELSALVLFQSWRKWCYGISWCCHFLYVLLHWDHHHPQHFGTARFVLEASELLFLN